LAGYFAGGTNGYNQDFIDKLLFNNESQTTLATTLSQSIQSQSTCNSTLAGYFAGGNSLDSDSNIIYKNFIDKLLFDNESLSTLVATLSQFVGYQSTSNSTLYGYFAGGFNKKHYKHIDKLSFGDETISTLATTLSKHVGLQSACQSGGIL
jgi:hypothetical protein